MEERWCRSGLLSCCVLLAFTAPAACDFSITIVHTNDVHARYEQANAYGAACSPADASRSRCFAGVARRYTKIKELRQRHGDSMLLLDAGDQYQGTFWFYVHRWSITAHFMRKLAYDAMTLGNHEFDLGVEGLAPFVRNVSQQFPVVSCNINVSSEPSLSDLKTYEVISRNIGGTVRHIGIVGYTTRDTPFLTSASGTASLTFDDEIDATRRTIEAMRRAAGSQSIDAVIVLGHGGYGLDMRLAEQLEDVDVVVGGHTHTFLYSGDRPSNDVPMGPYPTVVVSKTSGRKKLVVQDFFFGKYLGELTVSFSDNGTLTSWSGAPILLDASVQQDTDVLRDVERFREAVSERGRVQVGRSDVFLNGSREECRARECSMGNAIADAFATAYDERINAASTSASGALSVSPRSLAVINSGSIRASFSPGPITYENVLDTLPFNTMVDAVVLRGSDVRKMFEQSVANYSKVDLPGGFLQVSGFKVVYDISGAPYSRVRSVCVRCQHCTGAQPEYLPLDPKENYTIVIPQFIVTGGDHYVVVRDQKLRHDLLGALDSELFISYISRTLPMTAQAEVQYTNHKECASPKSQRITFTSAHNTAPVVSVASAAVDLRRVVLCVMALLAITAPMVDLQTRQEFAKGA